MLATTTFGEILWSMLIFFFWFMAIWIFITVFADIFRRNDLTGWGYRLLPNRWLAPLRRKVHAIDVAAEMHTLDERDVETIARHAGRGVLMGFNVDSAGRGFRGRLLFVG